MNSGPPEPRGGAAAPSRSMLVCNRPSTLALLLALRSSRRIRSSRSSSAPRVRSSVGAQRSVLLGQLIDAHGLERELIVQPLDVRLTDWIGRRASLRCAMSTVISSS